MASYKNSHKNPKMKSKFYSDISSRRSSEKPKKERTVTAQTKVVVRRLPSSMTEDLFIESVSPLAEYDYFAFINADSSLGSSAYSRAYINFKNVEDVYTFCDRFDGYVFVDNKGNEHPAMVEYAPFQKIPKRTGGKKKDARSGTIDEDADYIAFLEALTSPVTITLPPLEAVLEEIQAHDRELKANNGIIKVKTPLLEFIEQRKAEKLRSKEEKKEERRRKEFERKKAREEERKKKKEVREHHREMKKEMKEQKDEREHHKDHKEMKKDQKDDSSVKVLRPERGKEDYVSEGRPEKSKTDREKERLKREEERMKLRKERERLRREKEREERLRRMEDKSKMREEEKSRQKEEPIDDWQEEKPAGVKPEGSKSKRYSEGRRKEREREKLKEEKDRDKKCKEEPEIVELENLEESTSVDKVSEKEESESPRKEERVEEKPMPRKRREKDPRVERRIRNKDRPAMALYRPGQSRLSSRMRQDREEGAETSSSSPSPVMPGAGDQKKCSWQHRKENTDSSVSDCKEEGTKSKSNNSAADSDEVKSTSSKDGMEDKSDNFTRLVKEMNNDWDEEKRSTKSEGGMNEDKVKERKQKTEDDIDIRDGAHSLDIQDGAHSSDIQDGADSLDIQDGAHSSDIHDGADSLDIQDRADSSDIQDGAHSSDIQDGADSLDIHDGADSSDIHDRADSSDIKDGADSLEGIETKSDDGIGNVSKDVKKYPGVKSMTFRRSVSRE